MKPHGMNDSRVMDLLCPDVVKITQKNKNLKEYNILDNREEGAHFVD